MVGTNGDVGGYKNGHMLCRIATGNPTAHLCWPGDIDKMTRLNSFPTTTSAAVPSLSGRIIGHPPGAIQTQSFVADCASSDTSPSGAKSSDPTRSGRTWKWNADGGVGGTTNCASGVGYYCCCD
jgi:hypothetical protein